jgi:hypothetical protein
MAYLKPQKVKLPVMIALPVLLAAGIGAAYFLTQDAPEPPPPIHGNTFELPGDGGCKGPDTDDPLYVDPDTIKRPTPRPGAPSSATLASEIENEARKAQEAIRSRLELRFKNNEYRVDPAWTLLQVMRRLDALNTARFHAADYKLTFPEGDAPMARIECASAKGVPLADGPLVMLVNLNTGETTLEGKVWARDANGYLLLNDAAYRDMNRTLRSATLSHHALHHQGELASVMASEALHDRLFEYVESGDYKAFKVAGTQDTWELSCRTIDGEALAEPAVVTIDYAANTIKVSVVSSPAWMPLPDNRQEFAEVCQWMFREMGNRYKSFHNNAASPAEAISLAKSMNTWTFDYAGVSAMDVTMTLSEDNETLWIVVASVYGRPLPFAALRYRASVASGEGSLVDE